MKAEKDRELQVTFYPAEPEAVAFTPAVADDQHRSQQEFFFEEFLAGNRHRFTTTSSWASLSKAFSGATKRAIMSHEQVTSEPERLPSVEWTKDQSGHSRVIVRGALIPAGGARRKQAKSDGVVEETHRRRRIAQRRRPLQQLSIPVSSRSAQYSVL